MIEPSAAFDARDRARGDGALHIVIGENNADLATTLRLLLESEPDMRCIATAASASAVLRSVEEHAPNAFILDLSLDDGSSLPLISTLRERLPRAAIIVYTGHRNAMLNEQCVRAGANAVVVKTGEIEELTGALRRAARDDGAAVGR
ncbi:MAG: response regulator [Steroidobacteraceae bacterium]